MGDSKGKLVPLHEKEAEQLAISVNKSGFPLQIRLRNEVDKSPTRWSTAYWEKAWALDEESGYIDLVFKTNFGAATVFMVVECKRVREGHWTFLCEPSTDQGEQILAARAFLTSIADGTVEDSSWHWLDAYPVSQQAAFCIAVESKNTKTIEPICRTLISSLEGLANEERGLLKKSPGSMRWYVPAIVTTAPLYVCNVHDPTAQITQDSGDLLLDRVAFEEVPYVRFRKEVSVPNKVPAPQPGFRTTVRQKDNESVVFVINAMHVRDFLDQFTFAS
ncbi:MAG: hypothetical protein RIC56_15920 [Pseudomonadales bacterium]